MVDKAVADAAPLAEGHVGSLVSLSPEGQRRRRVSLGDAVGDAHLAATRKGGASIAFTNPGGLRADLPAGDVTYAEIFAAQPLRQHAGDVHPDRRAAGRGARAAVGWGAVRRFSSHRRT